MQIQLNGQSCIIATAISLQEFLHTQGYSGQHFAVALNYTFVPRQNYAEVLLQEGDSLEIVMPMQGG